jgi:hypothetical protein
MATFDTLTSKTRRDGQWRVTTLVVVLESLADPTMHT